MEPKVAFDAATRQAAEETFLDCQPAIIAKAKRMARQYGLPLEDTVADAYWHFLRAFDGHDAHGKGRPFECWLRMCIWSGTVDQVRHAARRRQSVGMVALADGMEFEQVAADATRVPDLLASMGDDARLVANLVLDTPAEVAQVAANRGGTVNNIRSAIRDYLRAAGWARQRINESWEEVRRALGQ